MHFEPPIKYEAGNPAYANLIEEKVKGQYFMHHNGFVLTKVMPGYIEATATLQPHLKQQDGLVHGGVTATIADLVTGFAAFSLVGKDDRVVTCDLKISYFSPGRGDTIFARGWVIKPGKRIHYCESEIYVINNGEYHLIAKGYAIMAVIKDKNKEG
jgi:uncharacterized protein (TIGR00369 family)